MKNGNLLVGLLIGAAVGAAVTYVLSTDKKDEILNAINDGYGKVKDGIKDAIAKVKSESGAITE
ncbi:MAG: YtxH domain-containing protein [Parabacteroides sp.]|nr:YtxH domain-containing protein [Parabacteroides sp.]